LILAENQPGNESKAAVAPMFKGTSTPGENRQKACQNS
jgi:hypothetical protein